MSQLSRRSALKLLGGAGAAAAGLSLLPGLAPSRRARAQSSAMLGRVAVLKSGPATVHSYVAPDASALVASHIIEMENALFVVDTQFAQTFAQEFRAYADSLGKPVERVLLSHEHPDHWAGANNFAEVPFVTTDLVAANVRAAVEGGTLANLANLLGPAEVAPEAYLPSGGVTAGEETVGGMTLAFDVYDQAEAPQQVVVRLPEAGIVIAQDLVFNNAHFFPLPASFANWIATLGEMRALAAEGYDTLLVGHGLPTSIGELDIAIEYLTFMQETLDSAASAEEATAAITARYPTYGATFILSFISNRFQQS